MGRLITPINRSSAYGMVPLAKFGVSSASSADQTTKIQSALNSGENIYAGPGTYWATNLLIPPYVSLRGAGRGLTIFKQLPSSSGALLKTSTTHDSMIELSNFTIDGNKANQTNANIGLDFDNTDSASNHATASKFGAQDPRNYVSDIFIINTKGSGFRQQGKGGSCFSRIAALLCDGHGFEILGFDGNYTMLDTGGAGLCGFYFGPSCAENRFTNLNSWFSGQIVAQRGTYGQAFLLDGSFSCTFVQITTQAPGSEGIYLKTAKDIMITSCRVEPPNFPNNPSIGIRLVDANHCSIVNASVSDFSVTPASLTYWLSLEKSGIFGSNNNYIQGHCTGAVNGATINLVGQTMTTNNVHLNNNNNIWSTIKQNWNTLLKFSNDAAAATGGVGVGEVYVNSTTGAVQVRLT